MARDTFTPGPWKVREVPESSFEAFRIESESNVSIAALYPRHGGAEVADARLMAAAPDLLASLTDAAIRCAGRRREKFREHRCVDCSKWLDVIEKAVGP